jgi:cell division protein FtsA
VIESAKAVAIPMDREIIHVLPQEFIVDEQDGIREPLGMAGVRLEAKVHIVTASVTSAQNIVKCCNRCGLQVADIVLEPLASAEAVLHDDEKELGVALVDIGGGTTDIAIFCEGAIVHTSVLPLGGNHLTNDVAVGLRTPLEAAEKIKQRYGCALTSLVDAEETIEVPSVGGRSPRIVARQVLVDIMMPRMEEIFEQVRKEIARAGYEELLASGIVLTGGATSLEGTTELAEEVMGMQVRRGVPRNIGGLTEVVKSPCFATGVGLVQYGVRAQRNGPATSPERGVWRRVRTWIGEIF